MTEKIARRGITVPHEYAADFLESIRAKSFCHRKVISLSSEDSVEETLLKFKSEDPDFGHQGYPVTDMNGHLIGVLTRRDFLKASPNSKTAELIKRKPLFVFEEQTLREVADLMTCENIGRIVIVSQRNSKIPKGIITRSDLLSAHQKRLNELKPSKQQEPIKG